MFGLKKICRYVAVPLAAIMMMSSVTVGAAYAGLVSTEQVTRNTAHASDRDRVRAFLAREDVRQKLNDYGVAPEEATARVAAMSDSEVAQLAGQIDSLPAGEGAIGAIVGAALFVFIVLLITDVAGVTDVFDFDN